MVIFLPFIYFTVYTVQNALANKPESYKWPSLGDYKLMALSTIFFLVFENGIDYFFTPLFEKVCRE